MSTAIAPTAAHMEGWLACGSAPGKVLLAGEYSVLEGGEAVVAAACARATATWWPTAPGPETANLTRHALPPEAVASAQEAWRLCDRPALPAAAWPAQLKLDLRPLRITAAQLQKTEALANRGRGQDAPSKKLGLGSSSAAAAAAAAALLAAAGRDTTTQESRALLLRAAMRGHHAVAPAGSGVDVAAAALGGILAFRRHGPRADDIEVTPLDTTWLNDGRLHIRVTWTGIEVRTSDFLARLRQWQAENAAAFASHMTALRQSATRFKAAFAAADVAGVIAAAADYGHAMARLGEAANLPIVEERLRQMAHIATAHGGAAKPSGAGGGDVGVAFFPSTTAAQGYDAACRNAGLLPLDLKLAAPGANATRAALPCDPPPPSSEEYHAP